MLMIIAGLIVSIAEIVVIVPALFIGGIAKSWRGLASGFIVALIVVLSVKLPDIAAVAKELGHRSPPYLQYSIQYAVAIAFWAGIVLVVRRFISGEWPIKRPNP